VFLFWLFGDVFTFFPLRQRKGPPPASFQGTPKCPNFQLSGFFFPPLPAFSKPRCLCSLLSRKVSHVSLTGKGLIHIRGKAHSFIIVIFRLLIVCPTSPRSTSSLSNPVFVTYRSLLQLFAGFIPKLRGNNVVRRRFEFLP